MSEEQQEKTETKEQKTTSEDNPKRSKPKTNAVLEQASAINKELGDKLDEFRNLVERAEDVSAGNLLMGKSNASEEKEEKKEETPQEYKNRILKEAGRKE